MVNNILVIKLERESKLKGYTTRITDYGEGWHKDGNNKRVKIEYVLYDGNVKGQYFEPADFAYIVHFLEVKAQKKSWGKWKCRNNYTPIDWVSGNYTTWVIFIEDGYYYDYDCWSDSYYYDYFWGMGEWTNYVKFYLSPGGEIHKSGFEYNGIHSATYNFSAGIYKIGTIKTPK